MPYPYVFSFPEDPIYDATLDQVRFPFLIDGKSCTAFIAMGAIELFGPAEESTLAESRDRLEALVALCAEETPGEDIEIHERDAASAIYYADI